MNPQNPPQPPPGGEPAARADAELAQLLTQVSVLRARGRLDDAVAKCQEALERDPENAEAHELLGDLYRQAGKGDDAMREYRIALARNPQRGVIEEKIARASLIAARRRRVVEQAEALLAGKADRSEVRKPGMAALFSLVIPGLGQLYNREYLKGLIVLVVWVALVATLNLVVLPSLALGGGSALGGALGAFFSGKALGLIAALAVVWIYAVADAAFRAGKTMLGPEDIV